MSRSIIETLKEFGIDVNQQNFSSLEWRTQDSKQDSILFYKFNEVSTEEIKLFKERLSSAKYGICIINKVIGIELGSVFVVDDINWNEITYRLANILYPTSLDNTHCIAITGTNGKTTTADLIRQLVRQKGKSVLTVGTLGLWKDDQKILDFNLTSPAFIDLRKYLYNHGRDVDYFVLETSSHAIDQDRFYKIKFNSAGWTSFSQDHLDYHLTLEEYFNTKSKIINSLKPHAKLFVGEADKDIYTKLDSRHIQLVKNVSIEQAPEFLKNTYNKKNLSIALKLLEVSGLSFKPENIQAVKAVPGRFNIYIYKNGKVIIDFAHTPDAIENICQALKKEYPNQKLITIFGCGGDRDKTKRPLMAKAAYKFSDQVVITSDNPRFEDADKILKEIELGLDGLDYLVIKDRKAAITSILNKMSDEVVLIAGKGHEEYLDIKGIKHPYSDENVVKEIINHD